MKQASLVSSCMNGIRRFFYPSVMPFLDSEAAECKNANHVRNCLNLSIARARAQGQRSQPDSGFEHIR